MNAMIEYIFEFVVTHGVQTDDSQWEFNGTTVWLEGSSIRVEWGPRLGIVGHESGNIDFLSGNRTDLEVLYTGMNALEYSF